MQETREGYLKCPSQVSQVSYNDYLKWNFQKISKQKIYLTQLKYLKMITQETYIS